MLDNLTLGSLNNDIHLYIDGTNLALRTMYKLRSRDCNTRDTTQRSISAKKKRVSCIFFYGLFVFRVSDEVQHLDEIQTGEILVIREFSLRFELLSEVSASIKKVSRT